MSESIDGPALAAAWRDLQRSDALLAVAEGEERISGGCSRFIVRWLVPGCVAASRLEDGSWSFRLTRAGRDEALALLRAEGERIHPVNAKLLASLEREATAAREEREECAVQVEAAGCLCKILADDLSFLGRFDGSLYYTRPGGTLQDGRRIVDHDPRCPKALADGLRRRA